MSPIKRIDLAITRWYTRRRRKHFEKVLPSPGTKWRDVEFSILDPYTYEVIGIVYKPFGQHGEFLDVYVTLRNLDKPGQGQNVNADYFYQFYREA